MPGQGSEQKLPGGDEDRSRVSRRGIRLCSIAGMLVMIVIGVVWWRHSLRWSATTWRSGGRTLTVGRNPYARAMPLAFSPDGRTLAVGDMERDEAKTPQRDWHGVVQLWDVPTRRLRRKLAEDARLSRLSYDRDGYKVTVSDSGYYRATSLAFSPDGSVLACGGLAGVRRIYSREKSVYSTTRFFVELRLWDVTTGKLLRTLTDERGKEEAIYGPLFKDSGWLEPTLAFSEGGGGLSCFSPFSTGRRTFAVLRVWDTHRWIPTLNAKLAGAPTGPVAFSPDCRSLAIKGARGVELWDSGTGKLLRTIKTEAQSVAFSADGDTLGAGYGVYLERVTPKRRRKGYHGEVQLWDPESGRLKGKLTTPSGAIRSVAFSRDGAKVAGAAETWEELRRPPAIVVWDLPTGRVQRTLLGHRERVTALTFSPEGKTLASVSEDMSVKLWDLSGRIGTED